MKERPILFSGSMVQAILNGTKTQTRRVVQPQPIHKWGSGVSTLHHPDYFSAHVELPGEREYQWIRCPYGKPGDHLWVRETHTFTETDGETYVEVHYPDETTRRCECSMDAAEVASLWIENREEGGDGADNWRPSIHMPRWASRITLEIASIRIQQLSDISHADGKAEGFDSLDGFALLWDRINQKRGYGWHANPWVWAVEFKRLQPRG